MDKNKTIDGKEKATLFLWCDRHCCFCGKQCSMNMEIHHIDGNHENNKYDNLIPVCFDCHGELGSYNPQHKKGTKYRYEEIKVRREQIYNLHTQKYLRMVEILFSRYIYGFGQNSIFIKTKLREWGDISCTVRTASTDIPVQLKLEVYPYQDNKPIKMANLAPTYKGQKYWNLNPGQAVLGHFEIPLKEFKNDSGNIRLECYYSIIDVLGREHEMLPFSFQLTDISKPERDWWYRPHIDLTKEKQRYHQSI